MLKLVNIKKDYVLGDNKVQALKKIDLEFRESEFVSILGQSGCGKTTLLNIIGGLDRYTSGDLIINGKSTKEFKDKDWDVYRNYSVGFVFQNYNLISHQTVLANVELALTLSGVSKSERRKRARRALEEVGLKDHINKKPNQLSGGQMQRVAIARALVNNPDIILADEPTGALDTETSVQIMELLKNISKNKLIIMVTHNPELAEKYSTRIIKLLDGNIINDSNPYKLDSKDIKKKKVGKTSMNFFTALSLSLNNLLTKKGRTFLTAFAGSIGIIGIALIMSLSSGMQNYINHIEEDTLSSYPLTIQEESVDFASVMSAMMTNEEDTSNQEEGKIYSRNVINNMMNVLSAKMTKNNLKEFKAFLDSDGNKIRANSNAIQYKYSVDLNIYNSDTTKGIVQVNPSQVLSSIGMGGTKGSDNNEVGSTTSYMMMSSTDVWSEMIDNKGILESQYDILAGHLPENYNEVVIIADKNNQISDYTIYSLGLKNQKEITEKIEKIKKGEKIEDSEKLAFSYDDLLNLKFKLVLNSDYYQKQGKFWINKSSDKLYMKNVIDNAEEIKVVGIIKPNENSTLKQDTGLIGYTKDLTTHVINKINESEIVKDQKNNPEINVFTGIKFNDVSINDEFDFDDLTNEQKESFSKMSQEEISKIMSTYVNNAEEDYESILKKLGALDLESPSSISIYPKNFDSKQEIVDAIDEYNKKQEADGKEENKITYSDMVASMMQSVTTVVNVVSYVLMAFVSISLVVSSIMIGIITYISVLERTKEIGILRAIGASKKDISRVFNAETFIVGFVAGILGIGITLLINIPINFIIKMIVNVSGIASLPVGGAIGLVLISMVLTVIAGLIPSKVAAKKDPVEALRTE